MSTVLYDPSHTGKVLYAVKADVLGDKGAESFATAAQGKTADELVSGVIPAAKAAQLATVRKIGSADFDGSADVTLAQMGAEPTFAKNDAFNKAFGTAAGTVCQGNDSRLSNARRASNISMSLSGTTLTISYLSLIHILLVPQLIKLCQIQQDQIDALERRLSALETKED